MCWRVIYYGQCTVRSDHRFSKPGSGWYLPIRSANDRFSLRVREACLFCDPWQGRTASMQALSGGPSNGWPFRLSQVATGLACHVPPFTRTRAMGRDRLTRVAVSQWDVAERRKLFTEGHAATFIGLFSR